VASEMTSFKSRRLMRACPVGGVAEDASTRAMAAMQFVNQSSRKAVPKAQQDAFEHICGNDNNEQATERQTAGSRAAAANLCDKTIPRAKDNCLYAQRHLPPQQKAFASTTNSICQHNQTHLSDDLPTHSKAFAPTTKGICPHNQRHLPPQPNSRALAPTTKLTCFHNAWTFCVEKFHTQQKCQPQHKKPNGICQHYQGHVPTHSMAFAPTTKLTYLQESL